MFHSFFNSLARSRYFLLFTFLQIYSVVRRDSKVYNFTDSLFLLIIMRSDLLAGIRWSVCMLKSHRSLCESFSRTGAGLCIYHFLYGRTDIIIIIIIIPLRVFNTSVSWWFYTGIWVTASILKSPGLFSVFWSILIMPYSGLSLPVLLFPNLPVPLPILWWLFQVHQLQLVSSSPSYFIVCFSSLARYR